MNPKSSRSADDRRRTDTAAKWVMDVDLGLSPEQQDLLHEWLSEDPRNRAAYIEHSGVWGEFDRLAGLHETMPVDYERDLFKPGPERFRRPLIVTCVGLVGCAAALLLALLVSTKPEPAMPAEPVRSVHYAAFPERIEKVELDDGSTYELKRGSSIEVLYSESVRLVRLLRGEAVFTVQKDPTRPFRVQVGDIQLEALGTVFNVRDGTDRLEVMVTEGRVRLSAEGERSVPLNLTQEHAPPIQEESTVIETLELASVRMHGDRPSVRIVPVDAETVERTMIWRPKRLEFVDAPLSQIVNEFNRRNELQITLGSEDLSELRITSFFWSDDVEAFIRLMEQGFGMRVVWTDKNQIAISNPF